MKLKVGNSVNVCAGWCCGANGPVDFIDEEGKRALVDFGGGRKGGLTWVPFKWLRDLTGAPLEGCATLTKRPDRAGQEPSPANSRNDSEWSET